MKARKVMDKLVKMSIEVPVRAPRSAYTAVVDACEHMAWRTLEWVQAVRTFEKANTAETAIALERSVSALEEAMVSKKQAELSYMPNGGEAPSPQPRTSQVHYDSICGTPCEEKKDAPAFSRQVVCDWR